MYRGYLTLLILILLSGFVFAQPSEYKMTRVEYIQKYKDDAIKEMHMHGVPASITLAQAMLESGDGNSALAVYANNHFGIKCHAEWVGKSYIQDDDERNECFRKYNNVYESYADHSMFLRTRPRYSFLFELNTTDYKAWAYGLKKAGYATDPNYAEKLIEIIEKHNLSQYDVLVVMPVTKQENQKDNPNIKFPSEFKILYNNKVKYVVAQNGDTYAMIAKKLDMREWQLYKYNETGKGHHIQAGELVYLQPKRNKSQTDYHIVKRGETLYFISQQYGVKLKKLKKYNQISDSEELLSGKKIYLQRKK